MVRDSISICTSRKALFGSNQSRKKILSGNQVYAYQDCLLAFFLYLLQEGSDHTSATKNLSSYVACVGSHRGEAGGRHHDYCSSARAPSPRSFCSPSSRSLHGKRVWSRFICGRFHLSYSPRTRSSVETIARRLRWRRVLFGSR